MSIKIEGVKTCSYYGFLKGIKETNLPVFSEEQIKAINYLSSLLPLVRRHEFLIVQRLLQGPATLLELSEYLQQDIIGYDDAQLHHALRFLREGGVVDDSSEEIQFACQVEAEWQEYVEDLLQYGLTQFGARYKDQNEDEFLLWQDYRQDQVLLKILDNPKHNQLGTYYKNGNVYIFAGLKKDASVQEHLNYKDKFLDSNVFQWESVANISPKEEEKQQQAKQAFVFVRKVES